MTRKELEQLVMCFQNSRTMTFEELENNEIIKRIIYDALISTTPAILEMKTGTIEHPIHPAVDMFQEGKNIASRINHHGFDKADTFRLTVFGLNQLYAVQKEHQAIVLSKSAVFYAKLACILTVIIPLLQFLYQLLCGNGK